MKLLRLVVSELPLLEEKCSIDFLATQRVNEDSETKMGLLTTNGETKFYQNNVLAFAGINASGKTTVLKLISFVCLLLANEPLNGSPYPELFDGIEKGKEATFDIYFLDDAYAYLLRSSISKENGRLLIKDESLFQKPAGKIKKKDAFFAFDGVKPILTRNENEPFLLNDVSIMVAFNKKRKDPVCFVDMLRYTNVNELSLSADCPAELISFFDPSIEFLKINKSGNENDIRLKFRGKEEIALTRLVELNRYLSSGTIKGIDTFLAAIKTFETGGYLIIDELENHFNHEILSTLVRLYMDKKTNPKGAVLIYSTHYVELMDEMMRNDNIYITTNSNGIHVKKLVTMLKRNDIKKSEAYKSGYLEGTVPEYEAYMALKKALVALAQKGD